MKRSLVLTVALLMFATAAVACGADSESGKVIRVPTDAPTINEAVDDAQPGDVVLIEAGTYRESVKVDVDGISIRGVDRNTVVLDGGHELPNGVVVTADDVAVENLTVHSFTQNGVLFNGIDAATGGAALDPTVVYGAGDAVLRGYRVSYVTAYNNGLYGIYAFASRGGVIEHSYVSGHPDSGIYVGQCKPCDVVIRDVVAERNAIGYYGTNASGGVYVIESVFRSNRLGVAPNSQRAEQLAPQEGTVVAGNLVMSNNDTGAPEVPDGIIGVGIAVGGGTKNVVVRNRVEDNEFAGIALLALNEFLPLDNEVSENVVTGNGIDLMFAPEGGSTDDGNCFASNTFEVSLPADIESVMPCGAPAQRVAMPVLTNERGPKGPDYRTIAPPPPQPTMPDSWFDRVSGAGAVPVIDLAAIVVPTE